MRRRELLRFLCAATAAWPLGAKAQEPNKLYKIGILTASGSPGMLEGILRDSLRELGLIAIAAAGDPVGSGLVASLARPGGNVTGTSLMAPDLAGKRLELLTELLPGISR